MPHLILAISPLDYPILMYFYLDDCGTCGSGRSLSEVLYVALPPQIIRTLHRLTLTVLIFSITGLIVLYSSRLKDLIRVSNFSLSV